METTLEMARRCPKCGQPGQEAGVEAAPRTAQRGAKLHKFVCKNERCRWYDTVCRVVQVNPDGTIPVDERPREKNFPAIPDRTEAVRAALDAQIANETS